MAYSDEGESFEITKAHLSMSPLELRNYTLDFRLYLYYV